MGFMHRKRPGCDWHLGVSAHISAGHKEGH
jgi:hypothetical protein